MIIKQVKLQNQKWSKLIEKIIKKHIETSFATSSKKTKNVFLVEEDSRFYSQVVLILQRLET